ncbi:MAG TPA: ABC transporter ATP-binding protein [Nakamurella sp.]
MSTLTVTDIRKSFSGVAVLRGVSLEATSGGITAVLGPSGCGKTTLLRLVAGFIRPDAGTIQIGGQVVSGPSRQVPPEARRLGYLAQEGALFPHLTVAENIAFGLPRKARRDTTRLHRLLELVSLDAGLLERYPHELSGGQQQRVALARTLAPEPKLILLDEPFSALDASLRAETRALVAAALAATEVTTLLVTHDQEEALSFADQIAIMRGGALAQVGRPREVYDRPVDLPTAEFIGDTCTVPGVVERDVAHCALGVIEVRRSPGHAVPDGPALLMLRPEQIQLHPRPAADDGSVGVVSSVEYFGHDCVVTAALPGALDAPATTVTCRLLAGEHLEPGMKITISVSGAAMAYPVVATRAGSVAGYPAEHAVAGSPPRAS